MWLRWRLKRDSDSTGSSTAAVKHSLAITSPVEKEPEEELLAGLGGSGEGEEVNAGVDRLP